jgi:hypothetical protein
VEKKQYELCVEVFRRLDKAGVLQHLILVGSWCIVFYRDYFKTAKFISALRTRDIDFMVPLPLNAKTKVNVAGLFKDLGFVEDFMGTEGYMRLSHPELAIEFLVQEVGRGTNKPYELKKFGINAQPLRYLNLLTRDVIKAKIEGVTILLPHPAFFAFHKLIIAQVRRNKDKADKDIAEAIKVLKALLDNNEVFIVREHFKTLLPKWQAKVLKTLKAMKAIEVISILEALTYG